MLVPRLILPTAIDITLSMMSILLADTYSYTLFTSASKFLVDWVALSHFVPSTLPPSKENPCERGLASVPCGHNHNFMAIQPQLFLRLFLHKINK